MTWFKVDDGLHSHRKAVRAGVPAMGLWVLAGSWSADQLTDGWIPDYIAARLDPNYEEHAAALVRAGLWVADERDGDTGWQFHQWSPIQPTRAEVEAERQRKSSAGRLGGIASGRSRKQARASAPAEAAAKQTGSETANSRPVPSRPSSSSHSSTKQAVANALGLDEDDEDVAKVIDLIQRENRPSAPGPYIRALVANGDLPAFLERVRSPTTTATSGGAMHAFEDDGDGDCRHCPMARDHPRHDTGGPHLTVVPDSA